MKRTLKIGASFSGKISTGPYENTSPGFFAEEVFEEEYPNLDSLDYVIRETQAKLHNICYQQFKEIEQRLVVERIQRERDEFRFYTTEDGQQYPSVTSILNFDADFFVPLVHLSQYSAQGTITHARVAEYVKSGLWVDAKDIGEIWAEIVICKGGDLKLSTDIGDFPALLKKFPITDMKNCGVVYNHEKRYAGTPDFEGIPDFAGAEKVPTLFDVKRTADKVKNLCQLAMYAKCEGMEHIEQVCIIVLNDKTEQGYSKPIVSKEIGNYFNIALGKREAFKKRYGC